MRTWTIWLVCILALGILPAFGAEMGKTDVTLDGAKLASEETNLGNFVADAIRDAGGADLAVLYPMAFTPNPSIAKGPVDDQAMRALLAFPTANIVTLKMTPGQLKKMMERALGKVPDTNMAFLQFSGMQVTFDSAKPANDRITEIKVKSKALDFADTTNTLVIAMPAQLANGAAGYFTYFNEIQNTRKTLDVTLIDAIGKAFAAAKDKTIAPKVDGRLKDVNKKDTK